MDRLLASRREYSKRRIVATAAESERPEVAR